MKRIWDLGGSFVSWERERERESSEQRAVKGVLETSFQTTTHPEYVL